jgi:hypothetical protein
VRELAALADFQPSRLRVDVEGYEKESARAIELLRSLDTSSRITVSDSERTALVREAREALSKANAAAREILRLGYDAYLREWTCHTESPGESKNGLHSIVRRTQPFKGGPTSKGDSPTSIRLINSFNKK